MPDINCREIQQGHELVVVECSVCQFHLGVDSTYLEQIGDINMSCPSCKTKLIISAE